MFIACGLTYGFNCGLTILQYQQIHDGQGHSSVTWTLPMETHSLLQKKTKNFIDGKECPTGHRYHSPMQDRLEIVLK